MTCIRAVIVAVTLACPLGCSALANRTQSLRQQEVAKILAREGLPNASAVEQQPQDEETVLLLVTSNLRQLEMGGCLADRTDIELTRQRDRWITSSKDTMQQYSFLSCAESKNGEFAFLLGAFTPEMLGLGVRSLLQLGKGLLADTVVSYDTDDLRAISKRINVEETKSITFRKDGVVEFLMFHKEMLPRLLEIQFSFANDRLIKVHVNGKNSIEIYER